MSNCTHTENKRFARAILDKLWLKEVMNAAVLFLQSNEQAAKEMQQNSTDSAQSTYLELHTWYPYENSERCNPAEGTVPVNVFTVRNVSDIRRSYIFRGNFGKKFHGCPMKVNVKSNRTLVNKPRTVWNNGSGYHTVYVDGWVTEMLRIIGEALNMSLDFEDDLSVFLLAMDEEGKEAGKLKGNPFISVEGIVGLHFLFDNFGEYTRSYLTLRAAWYTPCAVKYDKWSRFFNIFSLDMWICFALSLVLAVITVRCISNYRHKSHLHQSKSCSNIFSVTSNIIAVSLSVSVNTQPRSAPLRLFFFCWVCYSVAISTVFQAYLTTFLIEPGYEEPIKNIEQMLKSEMKFGFHYLYRTFFTNASDTVESAFREDGVECPNVRTCFMWATIYRNFSTILTDIDIENYRLMKKWTDENNRPLLCELEDGVVRTFDYAILFRKRSPFFEIIDEVIGHIIEGGFFLRIKKRGIDKAKLESNFDFSTFDDTYYVISVSHLQTAFCLLMLGYVLAVACFVTEIMWHRYRSKGRGPTGTSLTDKHT
jgi:hypothetical protein